MRGEAFLAPLDENSEFSAGHFHRCSYSGIFVLSNMSRINGLQIPSGGLPFASPIRVLDMRTVRLPRGRVVLLGLFTEFASLAEWLH